MNDPIVEEIRKYREEYAARFNFDLAAICRDLHERTENSGRKVISLPPKRTAGFPQTDGESKATVSKRQ